MSLKYKLTRLLNRRPNMIAGAKIHKKAAIGNGTQIIDSTIGRYSYAYECKIICCDIGAFCSIAPHSAIGGGGHPIDWVSTSPVFYNQGNVLKTNFSNHSFQDFKRTEIGNDVWIGEGCLIKGGVKIGDGAIIGMGSVVTHDVPPYEVWAGNPARFIKKRFDDDIIAKLQELKWWDWDEATLKKHSHCFNDPNKLIEELGK